MRRTAPCRLRGCREGRMPAGTRGPRANKKCTGQEPQVEPRHSRPSPRSGSTVYSALSLVTGLSCHHHQRNAARIVANLTPASGRQDHTASPSARPRSSASDNECCNVSRPLLPASTFVTIAKRPFYTRRDARQRKLICGEGKAQHFWREGWTGQIRLMRLAKSAFVSGGICPPAA